MGYGCRIAPGGVANQVVKGRQAHCFHEFRDLLGGVRALDLLDQGLISPCSTCEGAQERKILRALPAMH